MRTSIPVQNVTCGGCCSTIAKGLSQLENISDVDVDLENTTVSFNYTTPSDISKVKETLEDLGYPANSESTKDSKKSLFNRITDKFSK